MHTVFRAALCIAFALVPARAFAGPIDWGYTATFSGNDARGLLYLGQYVRPSNWEPDGVRRGSIYGTPTAINTRGAYPGSAHVRFGQLAPGGVGVIWADEVLPAGGISPTYTGGLTITDEATGATGAFLISGTGIIASDPMLYDFSVDLALGQEAVQEQTIGSSRYRVRFNSESDASGAYLAADISPVNATPEPGTLALAVLGACTLGMLRRAAA